MKIFGGSFTFVFLRALVLVALCFLPATVTMAVNPVAQGRWEFAITSGDPTSQTDAMGQSTISTYLLQSGSTLTNIVGFTTDTIACDTASQGNVTAVGSIDGSNNVVITFTFAVPSGNFQFAFTGVLSPGTGSSPTTITGTYQRTAGGCTQGNLGSGTPDGDFAATYFPDLTGTYIGAFDAEPGTSGPSSVPATLTLTTNADETLSGTVSATGLINSDSVACLSGVVTLQTGMPEGVSYAAGVAFQLWGRDTNGTSLWVLGWATNPDSSTAAVGEDDPADGTNGTINDGTNNTYTAYYGISGGPCDGYGGGDAPFHLVTHKKSKKIERHDPHRHGRYESEAEEKEHRH